ncbi:palmitoyl-protein thioesterase 1-like protein [Euroglyphus maynei]|uniref:Palmitoyl-protein thioesterase 1 n=1 Tax=Euroglyphus maynei TaxID=6958 RepID=A0A1Y3B4E6_EURMA|nr:palmitoyl-protein thioesterase 1-like protein [Euroglyphus maynei]
MKFIQCFVAIIWLFTVIQTVITVNTPVVMYHGMGDTAYGSINSVKTFLEDKFPGIYVTSIQMGNNAEEDFLSSYLMNLNKQVETACAIIKADPHLKNGYNGIGFSQGGQILRAIAQRCPEPPMKNLISLGGQHQGVYGLPKCMGSIKICNYVREMLNFGAYVRYVQDNLVQAEFWHDPLQEDLYRNRSIFLADINNEKQPRNESYKINLTRLKNLVLVQFLNDTIVQPKESSWFQFYNQGQAKIVYNLRDSPLYQEDWIGLKQLDQTKRLKLLGAIGDHLQFHVHGKWFEDEIVQPYLST